MAYVTLSSIHDPATGTVAPAAWGDQINDNLEFLVDPPACSIFDSDGQSVADDTITILTADSENFDNDSMHSTVSNTSRITIQTAGRYEFHVRVNFQASLGGGRRVIQFFVNGTTAVSVMSMPSLVGSDSQTMSAFMTRDLDAAEFVEARVLQDSGGSLTVTLNEFYAKFETR